MISENDLWGRTEEVRQWEKREGREREKTQNTFLNYYLLTYIQATTHPSSSFHQNLFLKVVADQDCSSTQSQTLH